MRVHTNPFAWLLALLVGLGCATAASESPELESGTPAARDELGAAFDELVAALRSVEQDIRQMPAYGDEAERVGGYRHVLRAFAKGMEAEILQDADYPWFRILDFWLKEGGDNPDQRYAFTPVRGGETYRVWGEVGSATRVEFQLYAGRPWDGTGRSAGFLSFEELDVAEDGSFELWVSADERAGNWLANPEEATTLFVRQIYAEWTEEDTGDVHIDRVGYEGRRRPPESEEALASRMRAAAAMFSATARTWPGLVAQRYMQGRVPNTVSPPFDTYALGGVKGRWTSGGYFDLAEGEALVIRMPKTRAPYQALQLTDVWFASLEYANQVSSLTAHQSHLAPDGAYYYVISGSDPGYVNWIDTGAHRRGTFLIRWDGVQGTLDESESASARLLPIDALEGEIPGYVEATAEQREATRRARRRHLQLRSHR